MPSTVAIVQARMGSRRLPGKSLADLGGIPVIEWVLRRLRTAASVDEIVLATSTLEEDDELAQVVASHGTSVVRGHPTDVLDRFVAAVDSVASADTVVRVTGDCP
ncbi:MAG: NTP transferase domain-containing protein, partial [Actinomycetota bacterium]